MKPSTPTLEQLPEDTVIRGSVEVATLAGPLTRLPAELRWDHGYDDLDDFVSAVFQVGQDDRAFALIAYARDPIGGIVVVAAPSDDLRTRFDALLAALRLSPGDVIGTVLDDPPAASKPSARRRRSILRR